MNTRGETNNGANRCERWPGHTAWQLHRAAYRKARRLSCKIRTRPVMRITLAARPALGALAPREDTGASSRHGKDAPRRARARLAAQKRRRLAIPLPRLALRPDGPTSVLGKRAQQHTKAVTGARHRLDERKGREQEQRPGPRRPSQRGRQSGAVQHPAWGAGGANTDGIPQGRPAGIRNTKQVTGARHRMVSARRNGGAASARGARATRARARSIRCP